MTLQHATTRTDSSPAVNHCPRCGRGFSGGYNVIARHTKACRRVPEPATLAQIFRQEMTVTAPELAKRYGCGVAFIYSHLKAAGIGETFIHSRGSAGQGVGAKGRRRAVVEKRCDKCGVLLKHPVVPKGRGDKCGWCVVGR